ncbi:uncharacterized protein [Physcomitrium patens]|nr:probable protein kinase DDB_G0291842 isoform X2 [Physcomitrium patens]XP_024381699.1 probable protein kinase DDB_G0291842 isoform X2 [Physcomitrium patens]XP_024381701.1 probable protein kinase DDB_G0291842 isoform X2 [Physcomitrium patens]XP_024381702.1 probable protein kinase DDB_G0291842 isoform X2 [Physcomitrium patens]|eukprot:XP_024381698.1 probable protein kinase DDB_G0291842 isoform X2 [Physcomitrella patens]
MSSSIRESFSSGNVVFGGLAGANSEGLANEEFGSPEAISPSRDGTKLLRTGLQPFSVSSARAIEGFDIRSRPWLEETRSGDLDLDRGERGGEVEVKVGAVSPPVEDGDFESPPTTPRSTTSCSPFLECPSTPLLKRKQLSRQQSLRDTKLLLTTHLKRTASIFMFDKHFEYLREIGRGSFSTVYEARDRKGGALCAVKMSKREFFSRVDRDRYMREIQSVSCLPEHPNVVNYFRGWQQDSHFYIQMELCEAGNLRMLLDALKEPLDEHQVWEYIGQLASALSHIHKHGVLHLDIKPENIFIDGQGNLKLGDFGLAVPCNMWDWEEGDGGYLAPELLQEEEPSPMADIYSFGAMVYEWVTGLQLPRSRPAWEDITRMPSWRSEALCKLVRAMLNPDPLKRPSAEQIISYRKNQPAV